MYFLEGEATGVNTGHAALCMGAPYTFPWRGRRGILISTADLAGAGPDA